MSASQFTALNQAREITTQAMKDQIKFLQESLDKANLELEAKQLLIHSLESEKREGFKKFEVLETSNFELQE